MKDVFTERELTDLEYFIKDMGIKVGYDSHCFGVTNGCATYYLYLDGFEQRTCLFKPSYFGRNPKGNWIAVDFIIGKNGNCVLGTVRNIDPSVAKNSTNYCDFYKGYVGKYWRFDVPHDFFDYMNESKKSARKSIKESENFVNYIAVYDEDSNCRGYIQNESPKLTQDVGKALHFKNENEANTFRAKLIKRGSFNGDELYVEGMYLNESKKLVRKSIKESSYFDLVKAKEEGYNDYKHQNVGNPYKKGTDLYNAYWFGVERAENESSGKTHTTFSDEEFDSIFGGKMCRKSIKESRQSILDKRFYELIDEGYIYDEDENGMNMSYGELVAVSDDLWETLENELKYYDDFPNAYEAYTEIMDNTSDDTKMFMGVSDEYFYFEINEDEGTYSVDGEIPFILEKLFKEFQKETDFERV